MKISRLFVAYLLPCYAFASAIHHDVVDINLESSPVKLVPRQNSPGSPTPGPNVLEGTPSNCNKWHTVKSGDYCDLIRINYGITIAQFKAWNPAVGDSCVVWLEYSYCVGVGASQITTTKVTTTTPTSTSTTSSTTSLKGEPTPGPNIPEGQTTSCNRWHTVQSNRDSCSNIETTYGITRANLVLWNPSLGTACTLQLRYSYCISVEATSTSTTRSSLGGEPTPGPYIPEGQIPNCNRWHTAKIGDNCAAIVAKYDITHANFVLWNPSLKERCDQSLWAEYSYCIGTGVRETNTGDTTMTTTTSTTQNLTYSIQHPITPYPISTTSIDTAWPPKKTQAGMASNCINYHLVTEGDDCPSIWARYSSVITMDDLFAYNPALGPDCSGLIYHYWLCVGVRPENSVTYTFDTSTITGGINGSFPTPTIHTPEVLPTFNFTLIPSPTQAGLAPSCQAFHQAAEDETCDSILNDYRPVTKEQFYAWNPALTSTCSGLRVGTWYCVAAFGDSLPPVPAETVKPTKNLHPGIVSGCKKWYMMTGLDTCESISEMFRDFSVANFRSWNTGLNTDCELKRGTFYCVGTSSAPSSGSSPNSVVRAAGVNSKSGSTTASPTPKVPSSINSTEAAATTMETSIKPEIIGTDTVQVTPTTSAENPNSS